MKPPVDRAQRSAEIGVLVNIVLAITKLVSGIVGHTYALIADAVESMIDIVSSIIVWSGLHIASQPADEDHPYGHGRAEALASAITALMLVAVALGIAIQAIREIVAPHQTPAAWTLGVLTVVIVVKELLSRRVFQVGVEVGSTAVKLDAQHHRSDVITSVAAFIGISVALIGGPAWGWADGVAALLASGVIFYNGLRMLPPVVNDLMDGVPDKQMVKQISNAATSVQDVRAIEKLKVRKAGLGYFVDLHVQADPTLSLQDAHIVSGKVKGAIKAAVPTVDEVLIHMEPYPS